MKYPYQLRRDCFTRQTLVKRRVSKADQQYGKLTCAWCGQNRPLYVYATDRDDSGTRHGEHKGMFCTLSCHNDYHGV